MAAGYTKNVVDNQAYLSIVATVKEARGKGLSTKLIKQFINIARTQSLDAVHLYTNKTNINAVRLYRKLGFIEWHPEYEPRPEDLHLIYNIKKENVK